MTKYLFRVYEIKDPYFGRLISTKADEIFKVFLHYTRSYGWRDFVHRNWCGLEQHVPCKISKVILTQFDCYVEVICNGDIPRSHVPSPFELIDKRYIGSYTLADGFFSSEQFVKDSDE